MNSGCNNNCNCDAFIYKKDTDGKKKIGNELKLFCNGEINSVAMLRRIMGVEDSFWTLLLLLIIEVKAIPGQIELILMMRYVKLWFSGNCGMLH